MVAYHQGGGDQARVRPIRGQTPRPLISGSEENEQSENTDLFGVASVSHGIAVNPRKSLECFGFALLPLQHGRLGR
jgi:hypothetical protein